MALSKNQLSDVLKIDAKKSEIAEIEQLMADSTFWQDRDRSTTLSQRLAYLNTIINQFESASSDDELLALENQALLSGENDDKPAVLSVHAGAGGTEAQDWAEMLKRMYLRFAEKQGWPTTILDQTTGEEAGIKSVSIEIKGIMAYGMLHGEAGVHRLVRISPFDADKARHTSFALVEVIPDMGPSADVTINEKQLKIDTFRASGHGGQSVNTTDSAVRITHIPSGIVVSVQNERSQMQNKDRAMSILKSKLYQLQLKQREAEEAQLKGEHKSAEWGNQIRSYVLQPYQQVKDHRTDFVSTEPMKVLDGSIDGFIDSYLRYKANK